jgi:glycerate 2-kinase
MRKRILISPNSFKECADSVSIAELIRNNLSNIQDTELIVKPISDGGDGFLKVCRFYFGGKIRKYLISTPYDESKFECSVLYCESRQEIYIESAEVLGFKIVPLIFRNPLKLTSRGLGELLLQIWDDTQNEMIKVTKVFIGIGGTSTIDMGIGMIAQLGLKLIDSNGDNLNVIPKNYQLVRAIDFSPVNFSFEIIPIADVDIPLLGPKGGIRVFGKQKNATEETVSDLEQSFNYLLNLFENNGLKFSFNRLSGAGGGIPSALQIFYKARLVQSSDFITEYLGINKYFEVEPVDLMITGEGAYDRQSFFGKGASVLIHKYSSKVKQIFLVCGKIDLESMGSLPENVMPIIMSNYFENDSESILHYRNGFEIACKEIVNNLKF